MSFEVGTVKRCEKGHGLVPRDVGKSSLAGRGWKGGGRRGKDKLGKKEEKGGEEEGMRARGKREEKIRGEKGGKQGLERESGGEEGRKGGRERNVDDTWVASHVDEDGVNFERSEFAQQRVDCHLLIRKASKRKNTRLDLHNARKQKLEQSYTQRKGTKKQHANIARGGDIDKERMESTRPACLGP